MQKACRLSRSGKCTTTRKVQQVWHHHHHHYLLLLLSRPASSLQQQHSVAEAVVVAAPVALVDPAAQKVEAVAGAGAWPQFGSAFGSTAATIDRPPGNDLVQMERRT
jgi:hypothetical protein